MKLPQPDSTERRSTFPWAFPEPPSRILVIRFHALGDVALTFPSCKSFKEQFPDTTIDILTSSDAAPLARAVDLFGHVHTLGTDGRGIQRCARLIPVARALRAHHYQVVVDIQRNWMSRFIRRAIRPAAWSEFDRFSMRPAAERTVSTFHESGFQTTGQVFRQEFTPAIRHEAEELLHAEGWQKGQLLVVLNPAGLWQSRSWPIGHWIELGQSWKAEDANVRFLLAGTDRIVSKSILLREALGNSVIDLAGRTSLDMAYALLAFSHVMITEDSGLMHMAWSLGKPLVALFGSSPHYWSMPTGGNVCGFHSGDLECGPCLSPECKFGDTRCLARVTPGAVMAAARNLLGVSRKEMRVPLLFNP